MYATAGEEPTFFAKAAVDRYLRTEGQSVMYVAVDGNFAGLLAVTDGWRGCHDMRFRQGNLRSTPCFGTEINDNI
jgi:hypothetical protein